MAPQIRRQRYKPIEDYAAIGNLRTIALVGLDGSIDWCCFPYLDSPSVFGALLDTEKGGRFRIAPARADFESNQSYFRHTNVLRTEMRTGRGTFELIDCMPVHGDLNGCGYSTARPEIHRFIRGTAGEVTVELVWEPRFDYARADAKFKRIKGGVLARSGTQILSIAGIPGDVHVRKTPHGPSLRARFTVSAGDEFCIITRWRTNNIRTDLERCRGEINDTISAWRAWVHKPSATGSRDWAGPYRDLVVRSELALKLMSQADTGALAAAATTSLPETIGGVRNWDYRYAWIRDAAQIARSFFALGHIDELDYFIEWAEHASFLHGRRLDDVSIMYPLRSDTGMAEIELHHLEGYKKSQPVRIGNKASEQLQLDIYGELLGAVHERLRLEERFDRDVGPFLQKITDRACNSWRQPDFSIWEPRNGPQQFVYSKMMVWVALERALDLNRLGLVGGDTSRWNRTKKQVRQWVLDCGYDDQIESFVQIAGKPYLDAANLLIPIYGFLPPDDPRVQNTIDRTMEQLTTNDLVYRYHAPDGLPGREGAFVLCTFWLIDALTLSGRLDEAYRIFDGLADRANHVGLLSEQIDPSSGEFLGNFPQAYSHVGIINSALYLAKAEGRECPAGLGEGEGLGEISLPSIAI